MADTVYTDKVGVTETSASYSDSLELIGKQDEQGRTIALSYFTWTRLQLVPLILRTFFLLVILALPLIRRPLAWLPASARSPEWWQAVHDWNLFSWGTWIVVVVVYFLYFAVSHLKTSLYPGLPGAEIHFARHQEIVRTVKPGQKAIILDFRVRPYAVVSTKPIALEMPPVEGNTRDNISLTFRGALILRVSDSYRLLVQGGFEKFIQQLTKGYESLIKDAIIALDAKDFNRFMIEEVESKAAEKENVSTKLERLGKTDLTLDFLTELTEIDEMDVSTFNLKESASPQRRQVIERLHSLAKNYGIEIMDHLPLGNTTSEEYLQSLARPLANSITRLEQSTDTLKEITEEEISEEITANVADKEIGVLEIRKIIKEIESITATLRDQENSASIVRAKAIAMENTQQSILAPKLSSIESLMAKVQAKVIDTAGLERYMREHQELLDALEAHVEELVPKIDHVFVEKLDREGIIPRIDVLGDLLDTTGTQDVLDRLRRQVDQKADYEAVERDILAIDRDSEATRVEESMQQIQVALDGITSDSGISAEQYSPEAVSHKMDEIAARAELELRGGAEDAGFRGTD